MDNLKVREVLNTSFSKKNFTLSSKEPVVFSDERPILKFEEKAKIWLRNQKNSKFANFQSQCAGSKYDFFKLIFGQNFFLYILITNNRLKNIDAFWSTLASRTIYDDFRIEDFFYLKKKAKQRN